MRSAVKTRARDELNDKRFQNDIIKKQLKSLIKKEPSIFDSIDKGKRYEIHELQRQHENEVARLVNVLETELTNVTINYHRNQKDLKDRLESVQAETREELKLCQQRCLALEGELEATKVTSRTLQDELSTSIKEVSSLNDEAQKRIEQLVEKDEIILKLQDDLSNSMNHTSTMEDEAQILKEQLVKKDEYIVLLQQSNKKWLAKGKEAESEVQKLREQVVELERSNSKGKEAVGEARMLREQLVEIRQLERSNATEKKAESEARKLREALTTAKSTLRGERDGIWRRKDKEIRGRGGTITHIYEEIRRLSPVSTLESTITHDSPPYKENAQSMLMLDEASGLTNSFDVDVQRESPKVVKSLDQGRKQYQSQTERLDDRDDTNTRELSATSSDEQQHVLPMQAYNRLSKLLETVSVA